MPHIPISRNDFSSSASNKTFKLQLPELNMINELSLEANPGDTLWRMWSNGYDVRLWSVQRGFDSPLSPSNEMRGRKASQTESLSPLSPSNEMNKSIEFDSIGGLRLVLPFGSVENLGGISWKQ